MRIAARWILGGLALAGRAVLLRPGTRANRVVKGTRTSIAPLDQVFELWVPNTSSVGLTQPIRTRG
jgi:hypothetical protein